MRVAKRREEWEAAKAAKQTEFEDHQKAEFLALVGKGTSRKRAQQLVDKMKPPPFEDPPAGDDEPLTSSGDDFDMYFERPKQLVEVFKQLEAQNLFLIQNSQETEQALEELQGELQATRVAMGAKTERLSATKAELARHIAAEEAKHAALTTDHSAAAQAAAEAAAKKSKGPGQKPPPPPPKGKDEILGDLHRKVLDVYMRCGFDVSGGSPDALFMLSELEAKLEDLLHAMSIMPEEYVLKAEKAKERQRRDRKRAELQAEQERQQEERNRKSNERSMMAPKKRTGRQVMFRSKPLGRTAVAEDKVEMTQEELDELKHFHDTDQ